MTKYPVRNLSTVKPLAFLLAGHSNWGKSRTLKSLTNENRHFKFITIADFPHQIRRMSNDDEKDKYKNYIDSCVSSPSINLILAFCPNFENSGRFSAYALEQLSTQFRLHIFVLRHRFMSEQVVTAAEIQTMAQFGETRIFEERDVESVRRATAFRDYIAEVIRR